MYMEELSVAKDPANIEEIFKLGFPTELNSEPELAVGTDRFAKKHRASFRESLHILVLGPSIHGKKRLLEYFTNRNLKIPVHRNISMVHDLNGFMLKGIEVVIKLWYVGNIQRSLEILTYLYKRCKTCFMLVYDVNDSTTFDDVRQWVPSLRRVLDDDVSIVLVGYEDLQEMETSTMWPISYSEGVYAKKYFKLASFYEFSDKTGSGVDEMIFEAAHIALESKLTTLSLEVPEVLLTND